MLIAKQMALYCILRNRFLLKHALYFVCPFYKILRWLRIQERQGWEVDGRGLCKRQIGVLIITMGADVSRDDNVSLVNPKEVPVLIALDLGYSEQEIFCCYEADMNAATSVERLCDFDTTLTDVIVAFKKKRPEKKRPDKDETRSLLMIETKQLYVKAMRIARFNRKRSQLAQVKSIAETTTLLINQNSTR